MRRTLLLAYVAVVLIGCDGQRQKSLVNTGYLCNRDPPDFKSDRIPGDNGLRIQVLGRAERYTPGQVYTISISGTYPNQKFIGFMLVSVPLNARDESTTMGTFQLIDSTRTQFAAECPHVIMHTDRQPKPGIEVLWTAPAPRVGCIEFRATVIERDDVWLKDDGALTRIFCEETGRTENSKFSEMTPDCCACGSANYQMTFTGKWSHDSHPKDYPTQRHLLHWSDIVGASHSRNYMLWQYGDYASRGVKDVCEFGNPQTAEQEVQNHSQEVRSVIKTSSIWWNEPRGINQKREAHFSADRRCHLVSMLTMIGPSPDWCVGISAVDLCLPNCTWIKELAIDLYPWDAGTDDGISYMSPNAKSDPQQKIHRLTNTFPDNVSSPFYGKDPVRPLASLKLEQLSGRSGEEGELSCMVDDSGNTGVGTIERPWDGNNLSEMDKQKPMILDGAASSAAAFNPACRLGPWSAWSACTTTCGLDGIQQRVRHMLNNSTKCKIKIAMKRRFCVQNECPVDDTQSLVVSSPDENIHLT